jgi:hypothetical protein
MRHAQLFVVLMAAGLAGLAGCSSGSSDDAAKFAGQWTFASGQILTTCSLLPVSPPPFDVAGVGVAITRVSASSINAVVGSSGCSVDFKVSGATATAGTLNGAPQTCSLDVPTLGKQILTVNTWTLTESADTINTSFTGTVSVCNASGTGILHKAPDGGTGGTGGTGGSGGAGGAGGADAGTTDAADAPGQ